MKELHKKIINIPVLPNGTIKLPSEVNEKLYVENGDSVLICANDNMIRLMNTSIIKLIKAERKFNLNELTQNTIFLEGGIPL